jgi:two-component sensor histidine kinase
MFTGLPIMVQMEYTKKGGFKLVVNINHWDANQYKNSEPTGPYNFFHSTFTLLGLKGHLNLYLLSASGNKLIDSSANNRFSMVSVKNNNELLLQQENTITGKTKFVSYHTLQQQLKSIPTALYNLSALNNTNATAFAINNDTTCLFYSAQNGIQYYNNKSLLTIYPANDLQEIGNLFINEAFADKLGNTWICASNGVYKIKITPNNFTHYFTKSQQQEVKNNQVRNIWQDAEKNVYANVYDHLMVQPNNGTKPIALNTGNLTYALLQHNNTLLTAGISLQAYNASNKTLTELKAANTGRDIFTGLSLNDSMVLFGKIEGLYRFNTKNNTLQLINSPYPTYSITFPYRLYKRKDNTIWAVGENGLFLLNNKGEYINCYNTQKNATVQLPIENFTDVFEAANNTIWLTTNGEGLYKWNKQNNTFKRYGIEEGFPSNILYRIEQDGEGNFWISSENGLIFFNPKAELFYTFYEKDGLSNNEFNRMSSYKATDGQLFFGGLNGVNAFYPKQIINGITTVNIPLRLIAYQKYSAADNKLIDLTEQLQQQPTIVLNPGDKFFTVEYKLLDFEDKAHTYAYKIEGQDKDWNYTTESSIRISGMAYGNYKLIIKARTTAGQFSSSQLVFTVKVNMPLYRSVWFMVLATMVCLGFMGLFIYYRTAVLQKAKDKLENIVHSRTTELKSTLEERELLLKEIHHRVKNNLQIISGLLDLQKEEIEAEESKAVFNEGQSRVKSIALIHQNLYQNDNLANIRFNIFVQELSLQVQEVFEQLNAKLEVEIDMPEIYLDIDTAVPLGLIVNELLTNAYKYAVPKNGIGKVNIALKQLTKGTYVLVFADNGPGFKEAVQFDTANTLGLRLVRGLAAQLNGEATYTYANGSVFEISFANTEARKLEA